MIFDVDDFKQINDRYGHAAGDAVLRAVSMFCRGIIRQSDVFARYGGEEFALLLPHTGQKEALDVAERVRAGVAERAVTWQGASLHTTVSVGVTAFETHVAELDKLLVSADRAMYQAKENGKNCVMLVPPAASAGFPAMADERARLP